MLWIIAVVAAADPTLHPGDPAPPFTTEVWLQGSDADRPRPDRLTVVEFWATWCAPCKAAIPHLAELDRAGGVDVVLVDIQEKDPAKATAWLVDNRFSDLPCADGDRGAPPLRDAWWKAAGELGIPSTFLVDGGGRLLWIGHPDRVDAVLASVAAGHWDAAAVRAERDAAQRRLAAIIQVHRELRALTTDTEKLARILAFEDANPAWASGFAKEHVKLLIGTDPAAAEAFAASLPADTEADDLNAIAWTFVDPARRRPPSDPGLPVRLATQAVAAQATAARLDTLAVALWWAGDRAGAIAAAERALTMARDVDRDAYVHRLSDLRAGRDPKEAASP